MSVYKNYVSVAVLVILTVLKIVHAAELLCYNGLENPQRTPLESPLPLIQNGSCIDTNRTTIIFVYGYNSSADKPEPVAVLSGYIERGGVNLLLLDWPKEAEIGPLGTLLGYVPAVKNTEVVGKKFATSLLTLSDAGLNFSKLHLVGHSLGAQMCGIAGLDPAKPLYEGLIALPNALNMNSAAFVDIIHSDPGLYGIAKSAGTADFWPNYKGHISLQPGCQRMLLPILNKKGRCSHDRSWVYFRESILNRDAFPAAGEPDYKTWIATNGTTDRIAHMGEYVSLEARGNYYLVTNAESPYNKGDAGTKPNMNVISLDNPLITPLESPSPLIQNGSCINTNRPTKVFISGFNRDVKSNESVGFMAAYIRKGDVNPIYLDWAEEAKIGNLGLLLGYLRAVENTERIGKQLASALLSLRNLGLDLNKVHIIGHSLGAQLSGFAGRGVRKGGQMLGRVTGLDAARPLYEGIFALKKSINKDCAKFVDIIHSDAGGYGIAKSAGSADFWPNYEGKPGRSTQPGCPSNTFPILSLPGFCSHDRSWMYYLETIDNCNSFPASGQLNYESWIKNETRGSIAYMGECVSPEAKGNYYLITNDRPPYGKGNEGLNPKKRIGKQ